MAKPWDLGLRGVLVVVVLLAFGPCVLAATTILDEESAVLGGAGATWGGGGGGYNNDCRYSSDATAVATYTFSGLAPGLYDVMAVWPIHPNRSSDVSYTLNTAPAYHVNQELNGVGVYMQGSPATTAALFQYLGAPVASAAGQVTVTVTNNHSGVDDYLLADAVALRPAQPRTFVMDDTSAGFSTTFQSGNAVEGLLSTIKHTAQSADSADKVSTWSFTEIPAGRYRVMATWTTHDNRTQAAPYSVWDGATQLGATIANQEASPNRGFGGDVASADGAAWRNLGIFTVADGGLNVKVQGVANADGTNFVIADAVRLEPIFSNGQQTRLGIFRAGGPNASDPWYFSESPTGTSVWKSNPGWGAGGAGYGDRPVMGDWNGDGNDTIGVFRADGDHRWYFNNSLTDTGTAFFTGAWGSGALGDLPVAGDWNGDGKDGIGVFRSGNSGGNDPWILSQSAASPSSDIGFGWGDGALGDRPVAGDWDGDGKDGVGLFRSSTGEFFLTSDWGATFVMLHMSNWQSGDWPVAADWDGDGIDGIGLFRPSTGQWFLDNNLDGVIDQINQGFVSTDPGDLPVAGVDTVPEPASALLLLIGASATAARARRRLNRNR